MHYHQGDITYFSVSSVTFANSVFIQVLALDFEFARVIIIFAKILRGIFGIYRFQKYFIRGYFLLILVKYGKHGNTGIPEWGGTH